MVWPFESVSQISAIFDKNFNRTATTGLFILKVPSGRQPCLHFFKNASRTTTMSEFLKMSAGQQPYLGF